VAVVLMPLMLRTFLVAGVFALTAAVSRGDSEIVIAIRYLQPKGTSHSHLYLYREDGKLLRQLTNDNSGQDVDPIFAPDGETIVLTREKPNDTREFWSIDPRGTKLKKLDAAPDWYSAAKSSPYFTRGGEEEAPSSSPTPPQEEFASPGAASESTQQGQHQNATALDAVADAKDRPPETIKAPDAAGEIFWRKGEDKEDPLDWVMWFRDSKSGHETQIGKLPGFPSFEPLEIRGNKDGQRSRRGPSDVDGQRESVGEGERANQFLFEGYLRFHGVSSDEVVEGFTRDQYEEQLRENKEKGHGCYGEPQARCAHKNSAAIRYGVSMYRPGKTPAVITFRNGAD